MHTNVITKFVLPIALAAVALCLCAAVYYPSENPISGPVAATLFAIATAAIFLCGWETWTARLPTVRKQDKNPLRASGLLNREAFVDAANAALTGSNQVSRAVVLIEVDGLAIRDSFVRSGPDTMIDVARTIRDVINRDGNAKAARVSKDQYAVLVSSRTSDQVLAMAEEILATVPAAAGAQEVRISIGICFCLPSSTSAAALKVSEDALRLAKKCNSNAWRSIAEGGSREVTRRALRAPTLARSSSGAAQS